MLLSAADLRELTGRQRAAAQCRALDAMGIVYLTGPDGHPRVLRALIEAKLGGARLGMGSGATLPTREPQIRP